MLAPAEISRFPDGLPAALLWLILPPAAIILGIGRGLFRPAFHCADVVVLLVFAWQAVAAVVGVVAAMPRPGINALWLWLGMSACYFITRFGVQHPRDTRLLAAVAIAMTTSIALLGVYQTFVGIPQVQLPPLLGTDSPWDAIGLMAVDESAARELFTARLAGHEPIGTFTLTNSFAGWLIFGLIVSVWLLWEHRPIGCRFEKPYDNGRVALAGQHDCRGAERWRRERIGSSDTGRTRAMGINRFESLARFCVLLGSVCLIVVALLRTGSRAAMIGAVVGLFVLVSLRLTAWPIARDQANGQPPGRLRRNAPIFGIAVAGIILVGIAVFNTGGARAAAKSLAYRFEYWRTALTIVRQHPWFGCGLGQFQQAYTANKTPPAGEEPTDPHNALVEIWATSGTPAAIMWLLFCTAVVAIAIRHWKTPEADDPLAFSPSGISDVVRRAQDSSDRVRPKRRLPSAMDQTIQLLKRTVGQCGDAVAAMLAGCVLYIPVSRMSHASVDASTVWAVVPVGMVILFTIAPWLANGRLPLSVMFSGWVGLVVNLCAAGGIGCPGIAVFFWMPAAIIVSSAVRTDRVPAIDAIRGAAISAERPAEQGKIGRTHLCWKAAAMLLMFAGLAIGCYLTAYQPALESSGHMLAAQRFADQGDEQRSLDHWALAVAADPWAFEPRAGAAAMKFRRWKRDPRPEQWPEVRQALDEAIARASTWSAAWIWKGRILLEAAAIQTASGRPAAERAHADAVEAFERAVECYPASPSTWAHLAIAQHRLGSSEAVATASRALELDRLTPHRDKKLAESLRQMLQAITLKE